MTKKPDSQKVWDAFYSKSPVITPKKPKTILKRDGKVVEKKRG